ncbi:MAG TPA: hypothetical protein VG206_01125, partial [Terriglobia bacterium]|nr:hypothetical protein [Terriglobia bacterium]
MSVGMAAYNEIGSVPRDYPEPGLLPGGAPAQVDGDPSASPHAYSGSKAGAPLNTDPANDAGGAPQGMNFYFILRYTPSRASDRARNLGTGAADWRRVYCVSGALLSVGEGEDEV